MDVLRRSQTTMHPGGLTVENLAGDHAPFDPHKIHTDLTALTNDPTVVHRVESLIVAQLAGFDVVATATIEDTITQTLAQLGYDQMAQSYRKQQA
ncbi:ATP cone domain-containing protein [Levilactobacillus tangyuanensis]|uniref:ATP cone domain-containing protein n=1 Tax=Levilactobacillus tangyuanensis TaxID=2486021 RepID=A0ABW1TPI0_9LACO|nr:ATP cone domain-containing protein [Levilactobacillus tangyuanensis]